MARNLSSSLQANIANDNCRFAHLLSFTIGANTYRFSEDILSYQGNAYAGGLRLKAPIRYSEQLRSDPVGVSLQNVSLEIASLLQAEGSSIQGQEANLERLYMDSGETLLLFRGRIGGIDMDETEFTLELITEFDPLASRVPTRQYSALCSWNFMDSNCGYDPETDSLDPETATAFLACPKNFSSCQARGRSHRYSGFLHLTRDVSETVV